MARVPADITVEDESVNQILVGTPARGIQGYETGHVICFDHKG
jgi:hypothetical protein